MASLTQQALSGMRWSALAQFVGQGFQYGVLITLAHLLPPSAFGAVATAGIVVGLLALLNELGLAAALIQRPDLRPGHLNAAFWCALGVGLALWGMVAAAAGPIAGFFNNAEVAPLLVGLALGFPLVALGTVPKAMLEKALKFKAIAGADTASAIVNGLAALTAAWAGWGAWSLVVGTLAGYAVQTTALWALHRRPVGLLFSRTEVAELFGFSAKVLGSRLLGYFAANIDYIIIGRMLGPAALGAYSLAYKLVTWPMMKISHVALRVLFPAFARVQHDDAAMQRNYMRFTGTLALIIFPLLAGLAVLAPEAVPLLFGPQWGAAVFPTQVLCGVGAFKALVCSVGTIFVSKGRPDIELKLNLFGAVKLVPFLLIGVHWGLNGVAIALLLSSLTGAPLQQYFANRLLGLPAKTYMASLTVPTVATAALAVMLLAYRWAGLSWGLADWQLLAGAVPLAAATYLGAITALGCDWRSLLRQVAGRPEPKVS